MAGLADDLRRAWDEAAQDLGIELAEEAPPLESSDFAFRVCDFGGPQGCVILTTFDQEAGDRIVDAGYAVSTLGESYEKYDRELFIWALSDWGWFGQGAKPRWVRRIRRGRLRRHS